MRIVIIGPVPEELGGHNKGGIAHHVRGLSEALLSMNQSVTVIPTGRFLASTNKANGVMVRGLEGFIGAAHRGCNVSVKVIWRMRRQIGFRDVVQIMVSSIKLATARRELEEADVIHIHGVHACVAPILNAMGVKSSIIVTVHSHNDIEFSKVNKSRRKEFFLNNLEVASAVVHVSESDREKGKRFGVVANVPRFVVYNGLRVSSLESMDKAGVCYVGSLIEQKRSYLLLEAMKLASSVCRPLKIIGDGPGRRRVEEEEAKYPWIRYYNNVPNERARKMIRESLVLVVPSRSESFGLVYIEALLEGTAVIGYEGTVREFQSVLSVTSEEELGLVALTGEEVSEHSLAKLIEQTVAWRRSDGGARAMESLRQKAIARFSWERVSRDMKDVYLQVQRAQWGGKIGRG